MGVVGPTAYLEAGEFTTATFLGCNLKSGFGKNERSTIFNGAYSP